MTRWSDHDQPADDLQQELRDLLCLAVAGDHIRWVLAGEETAELAGWLREAAAQWRIWADQVAGGLAALGVAPDGRVRSLVKDISLNWVPPGWLGRDEARRLITSRLNSVCHWAKYRRSQVTDPRAARLLDPVCAGLDAQLASLAAVTPPVSIAVTGTRGTAALRAASQPPLGDGAETWPDSA